MDVRRVGDTWEAVEGDTVRGHAEVWERPDGRQFLHVSIDATRAARLALLREVPPHVDGELHTWISASADRLREALEAQGFVADRREDHLAIDPRAADEWLQAHPGPELRFVGVEEFGLDRLRALDEELRDDVPGCDGWHWSPDAFRAETLSAGHDDDLYRIAVDGDGDEALGLVRVWVDQDAPRLGLVAVRRPHRGQGIARSLMAAVVTELVARDEPTLVTEADPTNEPIRRLLDAFGATVTRTMVDHVRPADA